MDSKLKEFINDVVHGNCDFVQTISSENRRSIISAIQHQASLLEKKPIDFVIDTSTLEKGDVVYHATDGWVTIANDVLSNLMVKYYLYGDDEVWDSAVASHDFYSRDIIRHTPKPIDWSTLESDTMLTKSSDEDDKDIIFYFIGYSSMLGIIYYRFDTVPGTVSIEDSSCFTLA